ncbi:thioredoxin family protein [Cryobacterium sp. TMT2-17-1]|uniref:thioredoxin family protein n=1 Tax=unclassified Cryobacterium TaxID=2649013 RepID=UPI00106AFF65|nr:MULTISPECIES: thioredoxin family protein [unclassified Cryobacterium]TFB58783.1 thioredoxin family protein [Cryobacterium sp. Hz7]TFC51482.1 thioredoxin family protein [Cryobacterium sp. TMT2-17-1]TFC71689.1 thioredoxin family protein [Cryobacterium sp. TMT2-4]
MRITVLTQASCHACDQAKLVVSRLSADYSFQVEAIGLDTDEGRALAARNGIIFAPGILIDDVMFSYGRLSEKKLRLQLSRPDVAAQGQPGSNGSSQNVAVHHNAHQQ